MIAQASISLSSISPKPTPVRIAPRAMVGLGSAAETTLEGQIAIAVV